MWFFCPLVGSVQNLHLQVSELGAILTQNIILNVCIVVVALHVVVVGLTPAVVADILYHTFHVVTEVAGVLLAARMVSYVLNIGV